MVLASLFPVVALIVLGNLLKRCQLTNATFLRTADRLVYYIFFPGMLFLGVRTFLSGSWIPAALKLCYPADNPIVLLAKQRNRSDPPIDEYRNGTIIIFLP